MRLFILAKNPILNHSQICFLGRNHLGSRPIRVASVLEWQLCRQRVEAGGFYSTGAEEVDGLEM